jgi:putative membrane protein
MIRHSCCSAGSSLSAESRASLVNAFVRPVVTLLSLPFIILTLGLMIFVINALMLMLTGWLAGVLGVAFVVDGFWSAVWGALIISIVTWGLEIVVGDATRERR